MTAAVTPNRRTRIDTTVRSIGAIVGGYALATATAFAAARAWPADRLQATIAATMIAFLALPAGAIYAFLAATPRRAAFGIAIACLLLAALALLLGPHR